MSYQTKKQSIGYILQGALKSSLPANQLVGIARAADKIVPCVSDIDNDDTKKFVNQIGEELELGEELTREIRLEVNWQFDMKTVEEAGDIFEVFSQLFPVLKN